MTPAEGGDRSTGRTSGHLRGIYTSTTYKSAVDRVTSELLDGLTESGEAG